MIHATITIHTLPYILNRDGVLTECFHELAVVRRKRTTTNGNTSTTKRFIVDAGQATATRARRSALRLGAKEVFIYAKEHPSLGEFHGTDEGRDALLNAIKDLNLCPPQAR